MKPVGVFQDNKLTGLAMPVLDEIRELRKYDIGSLFANDNNVIDLLWKFAINCCLNDNALIGNANAKESDSPLGVEACQKMGLEKVAVNCHYSK